MKMYRKAIFLLMLVSSVFLACFWCVKGVDMARLYAEPVQGIRLEIGELEKKAKERQWLEECPVEREEGGVGIVDTSMSDQRVISFLVLEQKYVYELADADLEVLLRIVEAEAGTEDEDGKLLVANVVLNRMLSEQFPDTVSEVVFQKECGETQFSPVADGTFYQVEVSDETFRAVERALMGEDISQGALYFAARKYADSTKMKWFDENLTYLFVHGGHEFFK